MNYKPMVPIMLFGWIPFVFLLFSMMKPRQAVIVAYVGAWLFLPMARFKLAEGIPVYDKITAATVGVLLGGLVFDSARLMKFRFVWWDLWAALWLFSAFMSSVTNDLGVYDGASTAFREFTVWVLPYILGRIYFSDLEGLRDLAKGIFYGGLIYIPLCLFELRFSPQLHLKVYGYHQHRFDQQVRYGGYRPMVFMQHGLAVAAWMMGATVCGFILYFGRVVRKVREIPLLWILIFMVLLVVACKSGFALILTMLGVGVALWSRKAKSAWPVWVLIILVPTYIIASIADLMPRERILGSVTGASDEQRGHSLAARFEQEILFTERAMERPLFGWGGWGRSFPIDKHTKERLTRGVDSLWVVTIGNDGMVGLAALWMMLLGPAALFVRRYPITTWKIPSIAGAAALAVFLTLWMMDNLLNAMVNPMLIAAAGGIAALPDMRGLPEMLRRRQAAAAYAVARRGAGGRVRGVRSGAGSGPAVPVRVTRVGQVDVDRTPGTLPGGPGEAR